MGDYRTMAGLSEERERLLSAGAASVVCVTAGRHRLSGLIWRPGLVVTADEALPEDGDVEVARPGGDARTAVVAGRDAGTDVALLRVDDLGGEPLQGSGIEVRAGATVLSVGALATGPVAAFGIVSHAGPAWQSIRGGDIDSRIDLDMRLPDRSEGGPVFDAGGRFVGMAVFGPRRRVLAIPAVTIDRVAALLETDGRVPRGYLGLGLRRIRLDGGGEGLLVVGVDAGGPGSGAGVFQGDILTAIDGAPIRSLRALLRDLGPSGVGRVLRLTVRRGGTDQDLPLTVGARPEQ